MNSRRRRTVLEALTARDGIEAGGAAMTDQAPCVRLHHAAWRCPPRPRWWRAVLAAIAFASALSVAAQGQGGAGFVEGEDIGGGEKFAVYGADRWFANHTLEWRAKAADCRTHLEAARAEEDAALALRPALLAPGSHRELIEIFHAHIAKRTEHLEAFSRLQQRGEPVSARGCRPAPVPLRTARSAHRFRTRGCPGRDRRVRGRPSLVRGESGVGPLLQKFKRVGTAIAAVGGASTAANMLEDGAGGQSERRSRTISAAKSASSSIRAQISGTR